MPTYGSEPVPSYTSPKIRQAIATQGSTKYRCPSGYTSGGSSGSSSNRNNHRTTYLPKDKEPIPSWVSPKIRRAMEFYGSTKYYVPQSHVTHGYITQGTTSDYSSVGKIPTTREKLRQQLAGGYEATKKATSPIWKRITPYLKSYEKKVAPHLSVQAEEISQLPFSDSIKYTTEEHPGITFAKAVESEYHKHITKPILGKDKAKQSQPERVVRGFGATISSVPLVPITMGRWGTELLTQPSTMPSKVETGTKEFVSYSKENPWETLGAIGAMGVMGKYGGKTISTGKRVVSTTKQKIPYTVKWKEPPQFIIKGKEIPVIKPDVTIGKTTLPIEYKPPSYFIEPTQTGAGRVHFKPSPTFAEQLGKSYVFKDFEKISTDYGSFYRAKLGGKKPSVGGVPTTRGSIFMKRITGRTPEKTSGWFSQFKPHIEKKVKLQASDVPKLDIIDIKPKPKTSIILKSKPKKMRKTKPKTETQPSVPMGYTRRIELHQSLSKTPFAQLARPKYMTMDDLQILRKIKPKPIDTTIFQMPEPKETVIHAEPKETVIHAEPILRSKRQTQVKTKTKPVFLQFAEPVSPLFDMQIQPQVKTKLKLKTRQPPFILQKTGVKTGVKTKTRTKMKIDTKTFLPTIPFKLIQPKTITRSETKDQIKIKPSIFPFMSTQHITSYPEPTPDTIIHPKPSPKSSSKTQPIPEEWGSGRLPTVPKPIKKIKVPFPILPRLKKKKGSKKKHKGDLYGWLVINPVTTFESLWKGK